MARDPNGNKVGTSGPDFLWGGALVLGDGSYDNHGDVLRGLGGADIIFGDIYYDGDDGAEGDE
ncbi:hypothetical protein BO068_005312, partial [Escherichia coli]|nr:hypothetical protein [Escherichia coli]